MLRARKPACGLRWSVVASVPLHVLAAVLAAACLLLCRTRASSNLGLTNGRLRRARVAPRRRPSRLFHISVAELDASAHGIFVG
jgi:hypothetical protein